MCFPYRKTLAGGANPPDPPFAMARPRLSKDELRSLQVTLWLNPVERRTIKERADAAALSTSAYIRRRAVSDPVPITQPRRRLGAAEFREVRRIGVNLNQIARALNRGEMAPTKTPRLLERLAGILERLIG